MTSSVTWFNHTPEEFGIIHTIEAGHFIYGITPMPQGLERLLELPMGRFVMYDDNGASKPFYWYRRPNPETRGIDFNQDMVTAKLVAGIQHFSENVVSFSFGGHDVYGIALAIVKRMQVLDVDDARLFPVHYVQTTRFFERALMSTDTRISEFDPRVRAEFIMGPYLQFSVRPRLAEYSETGEIAEPKYMTLTSRRMLHGQVTVFGMKTVFRFREYDSSIQRADLHRMVTAEMIQIELDKFREKYYPFISAADWFQGIELYSV